jgi:hypothetical protein
MQGPRPRQQRREDQPDGREPPERAWLLEHQATWEGGQLRAGQEEEEVEEVAGHSGRLWRAAMMTFHFTRI